MKKIILSILLPLNFFMPFAKCQERNILLRIIPRTIYEDKANLQNRNFYFIRFFNGEEKTLPFYYLPEEFHNIPRITKCPAISSEYNFQNNELKNIVALNHDKKKLNSLKNGFTNIIKRYKSPYLDGFNIQALIIEKNFSLVYVIYVNCGVQKTIHWDLSSHNNMSQQAMDDLKREYGKLEFETIEKIKKILNWSLNSENSQKEELVFDTLDISKHKSSSNSVSTDVE